ncbi:hypothetical protein SH449x_005139 [Pirellulaceae bacterium SH449]
MEKYGVFIPTELEMHQTALEAFIAGLDSLGLNHELHALETGYRACDVIVTFGIGKKATKRGRYVQEIIDNHRVHLQDDLKGQPVENFKRKHLVIERGFVRREHYYMVGWDGLNGRADFCNQRSPGNRIKQLGVTLSPWRRNGTHIVLCGQVPWDASVQHTDHIAWCRKTACRLSEITDRPIRFRPHPMQPNAINMQDCPVEISTNRTLDEDMVDAWAVVTFNSNAGVEATIAGVPAFAEDIGAMGYSILNHDLEKINNPETPCRQQWLKNLAYTQWNLEEISSGQTLSHLLGKPIPRIQMWWNTLTDRVPYKKRHSA